ncbi:MAG: hypothetical protein KA141_08575 [Rubrivivax sp.]|nr:hypothetical protein [Rubrivivax sp.]
MAASFDLDFKSQYDAAKAAIAGTDKFSREFRPLVMKLQKLMGTEGFDAGQEGALTDLRAAIVAGQSQTKVSEDKGILRAADAWTDSDAGTVTAEAKGRAGALKFLRHIYLLNKAGNKKVWIHSLPTAFTHWPNKHLIDKAGTAGAVKTLLRSATEHFTEQQKRYLANSTLQAMAWCQKAGIQLANAKAPVGTAGRDAGRAIVRLWFAETGLPDATLDTFISTLDTGFKAVIAQLNKGHFVLTDWVPFRGTTDADEVDYLNAEAFTFAGFGEGMDVVYIESNFFVDNAGNILPGQANWTRIIVHELTHLVCDTVDVPAGAVARYAHSGIGPHDAYPGSDCIRNADNWAFFAADCAGELTTGQRNNALVKR